MRRLLAALLLLAVSASPVLGSNGVYALGHSFKYGSNATMLASSQPASNLLEVVCVEGVTVLDATHPVGLPVFRLAWPGGVHHASCTVFLRSAGGVILGSDTFSVH